MFLYVLSVYVHAAFNFHAAFPCQCCMSMSMLHVHVHAACPSTVGRIPSRKLKSWDTVPFFSDNRISGLSPFKHEMPNNVSSDISALNIRIFHTPYIKILKHLICQYFSVCIMLIFNILLMIMIY
jgi:hypothetical protein